MKVVAFNGSPRKEGNTHHLLQVVKGRLEEEGIEYEQVDICKPHPWGCRACYHCVETKDGRCGITRDPLNDWVAKMQEADGILLASPTYFSNVSTEMKALIDRAGLVSVVNGHLLKRKVGAAVVAVRRAGALPTFDAMNHFFQINQMFVVGSSYWNMVIGLEPGDVKQDDEGLETMKNLGDNMAFALKRLAGPVA